MRYISDVLLLLYLSLDIICSTKLAVTLCYYSEQIMSVDKNPSIFTIQMEAIVYMEREKIDFSELYLIKGCNKTNRFQSYGTFYI